jgi:hypothetical protein
MREKIEVASSYESFLYQDGSVEKAIYRYYMLYLHGCTSKMRRFDFMPILHMRFESFFTIWLAIMALARENLGGFVLPMRIGDQRLKRHFANRYLDDLTVQNFVNDHSTTIELLETFERPLDQNGVKKKYDPNPLLTRPIINLDGEVHVIPSPECFINIIGNGIYYKAFNSQTKGKILGNEFELYVANHFDELKNAAIHRVDKHASDSRADWIVLFKDFSLIVEAKAQRLTANARGGGSDLIPEIEKFLGKAVKQINATKKAIERNAPEFSYVPTGKPILGLVVLLEPFYLANSVGLGLVAERPGLPLAVISAHELEEICALRAGDEAGRVLRAYIEENGTVPQIFSEWAAKNDVDKKNNRLISLAKTGLPWAPYGVVKSTIAHMRLSFILRGKPWYEEN